MPNTEFSTFENSYVEYATLHVPASAIEEYKSTAPWKDFGSIVALVPSIYKITYYVDGEAYKTDSVAHGAAIVPLEAPVKEGYTFSGWSEIPATMPDHDVEVNGSFTVNKYQLTYFLIGGVVYHTDSLAYGDKIVLIDEPTLEGCTFSGWQDAPATMPAHDVVVTGCFTTNKYQLTYVVDEEVYHTDSVTYGDKIVLIDEPTKEGYVFSGWSEIPATMPAYDVVVTGSFIEEGEAPREVLVAKITYTDGPFPFYPMGCEPPVVDGSIHYVTSSSDWSQFFIATEVKLAPGDYKAVVRAKASSYFDARFVIQNGWESYSQQYVSYAPTYTEWKDIEIPFYGAEGGIYDFIYQPEWFQGTVDINSLSIYQIAAASDIYKISYFVDNELFKEYSLPYGAAITPEAEPAKEGYVFSGWSEIPATMPDHDVVVTGSFIPSGISYIYNDMDDDREYYTLDGKRVNKIGQGIYIVRKKK